MYQVIDAAVLRAAVHPATGTEETWPELPGGVDDDPEQWRAWIRRVWADEQVVEAVEVASPLLAHRLEEICAGTVGKPRHVRRAAVSLARYLLRMRHRATPFGLFAGIAPLRFGSSAKADWGGRHHTVVRADAVWLTEVITRLEACPELLRRLPVAVDETAFVRGSRLVIPFQQPPHHEKGSPSQVSMRLTPALQTVVEAARTAVPLAEVADQLSARYPHVASGTIERLLGELVSRRALITGLRPPMTSTDALGHLVAALRAAHAEDIEAVASTVAALHGLHQELTGTGTGTAPTGRRAERARLRSRMQGLLDQDGRVEQPLVLDTRLDCETVLPQTVAREAEKAAAALVRLSPFPTGSPAWREYHSLFLERYGTGALVPVRDVVDADAGLGYPAGYRSSPFPPPAPAWSTREEKLLALLQRAALDGAEEITLDARMLQELGVEEARQVPAHLELCCRLQATTRADLDRGDFQLVVTGLAVGAGTTTGRFLGLLTEDDSTRLQAAYASMPTTEPGALRAQISSPPLRTRTENVARTSQVLPHLISLAEHSAAPGHLALDDLAVGADPQRLHLIHRPTGRPVEPVLLNAVELTNFTHPLARFLTELPRARAAVLAPFSWGAAHRLPYLPRVRYGRTTLAPARWQIPAADLPSPQAPADTWVRALEHWRQRYHLPEQVFLGDDDRRIRLDLSQHPHRQLLRAHLHTTGHATVYEAPEAAAYGWLGGHAHEIVTPLAATLPMPSATVQWASTVRREHGHLPGESGWLYAKLFGHAERQHELLTHHLPALLTHWGPGEAPEWWFVRYADPQPHLRLRVKLPDAAAYGTATAHLSAWATGLRREGLLSDLQLHNYRPETGRYGTGQAMDAAEAFFAADSAAALAQMTHTTHPDGPQALTAASFTDIATAFLGDRKAGLRWLINRLTRQPAPAAHRDLQAETIRLTRPGDGQNALSELPGGDQITAAWRRRAKALASYRARLEEGAGPTTEEVLPSLLHMHHIRAHGIDEDCERSCHHLARTAALSWTARHQGAAR